MTDRATTRLRNSINAEKLLIMPGGFSPLAARMCESLGYESFFLAGSQTNAHIYGQPDIGLIGLQEMAAAARNIAAVSSIPVLADSDTGFGNAVSVHHAVETYVRAGAGGLHIEDQEFPKLSGTAAGRRCISTEEAVGKYRAAVAARDAIDPDFVVCARCDFIGAEGGDFEGAIERCLRYQEAGADLIWLNNVQHKEQVHEAAERIPGAVMPTFGGAPPAPSLEELQEWGVAVAIFPAMTSSVGLQAVWELMNDFKERGLAAMSDRRQQAAAGKWGAADFHNFVYPGGALVRDIEDKYLPRDVQRDYDSTFGHFRPPT